MPVLVHTQFFGLIKVNPKNIFWKKLNELAKKISI